MPKKVLIKGLKTALVVGSVLTLINQWQGLFGDEPIRWLALGLTYCVPFCVFVYSWWTNSRDSH